MSFLPAALGFRELLLIATHCAKLGFVYLRGAVHGKVKLLFELIKNHKIFKQNPRR